MLNSPRIRAHTDECGRWNFGLGRRDATARGTGAAVVIDGRKATFGVETNRSLAAAWIVIDTFVANETLAP